MEFKNISFPIKNDLPLKALSFEEYYKEILHDTIFSKQEFEMRVKLTSYNCTDSEKIVLNKSSWLCGHYFYPIRIDRWGLMCKFCHSKIVEPKPELKERGVVLPLFCPKCNSSIRNLKCLYCDKDISTSYLGIFFCEDCLNFIDEMNFKEAFKQKKKEIIEKSYVEPQKTIYVQPHKTLLDRFRIGIFKNEIKNPSKVCLEKYCHELPDESNEWFCGKHWEDYKVFKDKLFYENKLSDYDRSIMKIYKNELENPSWVWIKYLIPALKLAKNGKYKKGQDIIKQLLNNKVLLPEYALKHAYEIMGDLCFLNEEFDRAISYYKNYSKEKHNAQLWVGDINKILNARRLAGESMAGDEIIDVSQSSFYSDRFTEGSDPLAGYTKNFKPISFVKRNKDLIGKFAEELAIEWEKKNKKKLLNMGGKKHWYYFDRVGWDFDVSLIEDNISFSLEPEEEDINKDGLSISKLSDSDWYYKPFKKFRLLNYSYSEEKPFKKFIETIVEIVYEAEKLTRQHMGVPNRGEGWIAETELYYKVKNLFSNFEVLHQARPKWLSPQHLDIYIPKINLAIEYQGLHHVRPIEFFGGEKAYLETIRRDRRKRELCVTNNVELIYIYENEKIEQIDDKLRELIDRYIE